MKLALPWVAGLGVLGAACGSSPRTSPPRDDAGGADRTAPREAGAHGDDGSRAKPDAAREASSGTRVVAFGSGLTATLGDDGALTITSNGATVLSTAAGQPLFSSAVDATSPEGWHDPSTLSGETFTALPSSAITVDSTAPGTLHLTAVDTRADVVLVSLALGSDGGFYTGLGERYDHVDPHGQIVGMQLELDGDYESGTTDRHVPVPWLVSSNGYGIFVANRQAGAWDVASTDASVVRSTFEGSSLDVTIVVDPDPLAVVATLGRLVGLPRATPSWVLGPMMWRHVDSQAELLTDLAHIRSLHIPTTTYWIDDGWQNAIDTLDFTSTKYTDVPTLMSTARSLGFRMFAWNSPYLQSPGGADAGTNEAQGLYPTAVADGYFVEQGNAPFPAPGPGGGLPYGLVDFTSAAATSFWVERALTPVKLGVDGFKLDYGEDMIPDLFGQRLGLSLADGETERTARNYPLRYHAAYRQALETPADAGAAVGDDGVLVVRASTYGGATVADIVWPGDLDNGFQTYGQESNGTLFVGGLPASIVAMQTLSVSGFPLYGADTGGYRGGAPTEEALLRWAEHTALSMVMQLGPGENKYPWNYGTSTVTTYTALATLHQTLFPYLLSLLASAQANGTPTVRPLPLAYPKDSDAVAFADDEYLLGPSLLVAPVTTEGVTSRLVHLPPGRWFPYWGGGALSGPVTLTADAPIGQPPLYVLAGTLLPTIPPGIDTLVASDDPSTVSASALSGQDTAAGWVMGSVTTTCVDGSTIAVADDTNGVTVTWTPEGTGNTLTMTLDMSERVGNVATLTTVTSLAGAAPAAETSASAVSSATASAYFLSGNSLTLRVVGPGTIRVAPGP